MELLCKIPDLVIKVVPLGLYIHEGESHPAALILTKHNVLVVNTDNGALIQKYDFKRFYEGLKDCVYVAHRKTFVALLADGMLVAWEVDQFSQATKETWNPTPLQLGVDGDRVVVLCSGGHVCTVEVKNHTLLRPSHTPTPVLPQVPDNPDCTLLSPPSSVLISTIAAELPAAKKSRNGVSKERVYGVVGWWQGMSGGTASEGWVSAASGTHIPLPLPSGSEICHVFVSHTLGCLHVLHRESHTGAVTWSKFDWHAAHLFSASLPPLPTHFRAFMSATCLYVVDAAADIHVFEGRYGKALGKVAGSAEAGSTNDMVLCMDTANPSAVCMYYAVKTNVESTYILYRHVLPSTPYPSLSHLLSLQDTPSALALVPTQSLSAQFSILSQLSSSEQEGLSALLSKYHKRVCQESDMEKVRRALGKRKLGDEEDRSYAAGQRFLSHVCDAASSPFSVDWEHAKACVRAGLGVGLAEDLVRKARAAGRWDVLGELLRSMVDMSEDLVVQVLHSAMKAKEDSLKSYIILGCAIWNTETYTYDPATHSLTAAPSSTSKKSSKSPQTLLTPLTLTQALLEAALLRAHPYPSYLISEAAQPLPA
eukprot:gene30860-37292_t